MAWSKPRPDRPAAKRPFAGAYIGAAVGFARQRVEVNNPTIGAPARALPSDDNDGSVTFGGYVGYNWQRCCSPFVFGIETDFNYLDTSPTALDSEPPGPAGLAETTSLRAGWTWFGTLRGRAGYVVHDHVLLYATGGLAYAQVNHTLSRRLRRLRNSSPSISGRSRSPTKDTKVGWTVGGGAELLHDSNWLLRAEALYVDLGSDNQSPI